MNQRKRIGLIAHDLVSQPQSFSMLTGTASPVTIFMQPEPPESIADDTGLAVHCLKSGPLGGDQQMGAMIADGRLDILLFFTDPMTSMPHDVDVKALLRLCTLYNVVLACNQASADFVLGSPLFDSAYEAVETDNESYLNRALP